MSFFTVIARALSLQVDIVVYSVRYIIVIYDYLFGDFVLRVKCVLLLTICFLASCF